MKKVFIIVSVLIISLTVSLYAKDAKVTPQELRKEYIRKGLSYDDAQQYKQAISAYTKAIRLAPKDSVSAEAYFNRGCSYVYLGKHTQAIADYTKAIKLSSTPNAGYHFCRGALYYDKRNYLQAVKDFDRIIELVSESEAGDAYYYRGSIFHKQNNYYEAIDNFNKAIEIDASNADAYNDRGTVYYDVGNFDSARSDWDKVLEIDPQGEAAKVASKNLRLLSGKAAKKTTWGQNKEEKSGYDARKEENNKESLLEEWEKNIGKAGDAMSDDKLSSAQISISKSIDIAKQLKEMVKGNDEEEEIVEAMENISLGFLKFIKFSREMEKLVRRMERVEKASETSSEFLNAIREMKGYLEESLVYFEDAESKASQAPYLLEISQDMVKEVGSFLKDIESDIEEMETDIEEIEREAVKRPEEVPSDQRESQAKSRDESEEKKKEAPRVDSGEIKKLEKEWATYIKDVQKAINKKDFFSAAVYVNTSLELLSHLEDLLKAGDLSQDKLGAMQKVSSIYEHLRGLAEVLDTEELSDQDKENLEGAIEFTYKQLKEVEESPGNDSMIRGICKSIAKELKKLENEFAKLSKKKAPKAKKKVEKEEEFVYERRKDLGYQRRSDTESYQRRSENSSSRGWGSRSETTLDTDSQRRSSETSQRKSAGGSFSRPKDFYNNYCRVFLPILEKQMTAIRDKYSPGENVDDAMPFKSVSDCTTQLLEQEEELKTFCLADKSEKECDQAVTQAREMYKTMITRKGCKKFYTESCEGYYSPSSDREAYSECMADINKYCDSLPESVSW